MKQLAFVILTTITDLGLEDPLLLRIVGYKLSNEGELEQAANIFERVLKLRTSEPQSYRDLGLIYGDLKKYTKCLELLWKVVIGKWDSRFDEIELTTLMEMNRIMNLVGTQNIPDVDFPEGMDEVFIKNLDCDVRISMGWDTNDTDIDLHVVEPDGTECYYGHNRTTMGGLVSRDFRYGYGPEEYMIRFALPGKYVIKAKYYANNQQSLSGATTILLNIYTHFGRSPKS